MRKTTSNIKYQAVMSQSRQEFMPQNKKKYIQSNNLCSSCCSQILKKIHCLDINDFVYWLFK